MPSVEVDETLQMYYESTCAVEPWRSPETIVLVHGVGGNAVEWFAWVPLLSTRYRVLAVDLRGWGRSTVPPERYEWSMERYADDLVRLQDKLGLERVHYVGTKLGGRIGLHLARRYPERLHSLTLVCTPMTIRFGPGDDGGRLPRTIEGKEGLRRWAERSMPGRLGDVSPEMMAWWTDLYASCSPRVVSEILKMAWLTDESGLLPEIRTPTLVIDSNDHMGINGQPDWPSLMPDATYAEIALATEGRQISATKPLECAGALLDFLSARFGDTLAASA